MQGVTAIAPDPDVQAVDNPKTKRDEALNRALQTLAGEAQ